MFGLFCFPFPSFYRTNAQPFRIRGKRAKAYFYRGVSPATRKAYRTGLRKFNSFCTQARRKAIPTLENTLLLFTTYLASQNLSSSTIQVYLSAVRNAHVAKGQYSQFKSQLTPRLYQVIKGIQKTQYITKSPKARQPTYNFQNIGRCTISAA